MAVLYMLVRQMTNLSIAVELHSLFFILLSCMELAATLGESCLYYIISQVESVFFL